MGRFKLKLRKSDTLFSRYIRRGGKCEICGRSDIKLEAAHYFSRGKESTRFDERNVHCLDYTCHRKSHEGDTCYKDFMLSKYGQDGLDRLEFLSNQYQKRDDVMSLLYCQALLKESSPGSK
jgi:hypothetical protein